MNNNDLLFRLKTKTMVKLIGIWRDVLKLWKKLLRETTFWHKQEIY